MEGPIETTLLINNKLVPASDNATFDLFSPHTGELVAKGMFIIGSSIISTDKIVQSQKRPSQM
jgi:hypothetical protein